MHLDGIQTLEAGLVGKCFKGYRTLEYKMAPPTKIELFYKCIGQSKGVTSDNRRGIFYFCVSQQDSHIVQMMQTQKINDSDSYIKKMNYSTFTAFKENGSDLFQVVKSRNGDNSRPNKIEYCELLG